MEKRFCYCTASKVPLPRIIPKAPAFRLGDEGNFKYKEEPCPLGREYTGFTFIVIPGLTRNPVFLNWISAIEFIPMKIGAGMTASELM